MGTIIVGRGDTSRSLATQFCARSFAPGEDLPRADLVLVPINKSDIVAPLCALNELDWVSTCENILIDARRALRSVSASMPAQGGSVILVVERLSPPHGQPSIADETVYGGVRALMLSAAMAWKERGVTVNLLDVAAPLMQHAAAITAYTARSNAGITGQCIALERTGF